MGQLAVMAFGVADTMVAGRYSEEALAALSVGSAVYISSCDARAAPERLTRVKDGLGDRGA